MIAIGWLESRWRPAFCGGKIQWKCRDFSGFQIGFVFWPQSREHAQRTGIVVLWVCCLQACWLCVYGVCEYAACEHVAFGILSLWACCIEPPEPFGLRSMFYWKLLMIQIVFAVVFVEICSKDLLQYVTLRSVTECGGVLCCVKLFGSIRPCSIIGWYVGWQL